MSANLTPHWGLIIFLMIAYTVSALMHLDPTIAHPGGASIITGVTISSLDITAFIVAIIAALAAAAIIGVILGGWAGVAAFFGTLLVASAITNAWSVIFLAASVVTFSDLGLPIWLQFLIAAPCVIILTWTALAFIAAVTGIGSDIKPGGA